MELLLAEDFLLSGFGDAPVAPAAPLALPGESPLLPLAEEDAPEDDVDATLALPGLAPLGYLALPTRKRSILSASWAVPPGLALEEVLALAPPPPLPAWPRFPEEVPEVDAVGEFTWGGEIKRYTGNRVGCLIDSSQPGCCACAPCRRAVLLKRR